MNGSTPAKSLNGSTGRWRSLRPRTRTALAFLAVTLPFVALFLLPPPEKPDDWPARALLSDPGLYWPLGFSPDGRTFLTYNKGGITPWDTTTGRKGQSWTDQGLAVIGAFSPDGRTFAASTRHERGPTTIELIDTSSGRSRATIQVSPNSSSSTLAFDEEGRMLRAYRTDDGVAEISSWDASTGEQLPVRKVNLPSGNGPKKISSDGRLLVFALDPWDAIQLWDLDQDRSLGQLSRPSGNAPYGRGLAISADGQTVAAGRNDGIIDVWDVPNGKLLKTLPAPTDGYRLWEIRLAPDGRTLASSVVLAKERSAIEQSLADLYKRLFNGQVLPKRLYAMLVFDLATGDRVAKSSSSTWPIYSPDGRSLALRQEDASIKIMDIPTPSK